MASAGQYSRSLTGSAHRASRWKKGPLWVIKVGCPEGTPHRLYIRPQDRRCYPVRLRVNGGRSCRLRQHRAHINGICAFSKCSRSTHPWSRSEQIIKVLDRVLSAGSKYEVMTPEPLAVPPCGNHLLEPTRLSRHRRDA